MPEMRLKKQKGGSGFYKLIGKSFEQLTVATDSPES
jgi:hypothetical protein